MPSRRTSRDLGVVATLAALGACGTEELERNRDGPVVVQPWEVHNVAAPEQLARVLDVQPTDDARIWVLNSTEPFFVVVAQNGGVERAFGRSGGGPEEYGAPVALVRGPGAGEVWTYDVPRHAVRRVGPEPGRDIALPSNTLAQAWLVSFQGAGFRPAPPWLAGVADGILLARGRPSIAAWTGLRLWEADVFLVRTAAPGALVERRHAVADLLDDPASRYQGATTFLPYPIWTLCDDGGLRLYDPLANSIRRFDSNSVEHKAFPLPRERRLATTFDRVFGMMYRQYRAEAPASQVPDSVQMRGVFEAQFGELVATSADVMPEYADLRCAGQGTLWLQPFDAAAAGFGRGQEWWRIAEDGSRTTYHLPQAFTAFRFTEDRIWGTVVDSLGIPSVAWIAVQR